MAGAFMAPPVPDREGGKIRENAGIVHASSRSFTETLSSHSAMRPDFSKADRALLKFLRFVAGLGFSKIV
jgi:hypothetical protein